MDPLQFSLFFAALAVAYLLVHLRLVRFETYMKEMAGIKQLNDRLKALSESLERVRVDGVEDRIEQVHADLEALIEAAGRIERAQSRAVEVTLSEVPQSSVAAAPVTTSASERIRALVETRLLDLGYRNLRILTDLSQASLDEEFEVLVECVRNHMPCKGKVATRNGSIRDVDVQSVSQLFP